MSITSSSITEDRPQLGGRRHVCERHTDHLGQVHDIRYMALTADNVNTFMAARVPIIEAQLKAAEIAANMGKALNAELAYTFNHSTVAENRTALRELFKTATRWELLTLGWVIHELALSDNQLKSLFGVNDAELPALKAKLLDIHDKYEDALALVGQ